MTFAQWFQGYRKQMAGFPAIIARDMPAAWKAAVEECALIAAADNSPVGDGIARKIRELLIVDEQ